MIRLDRVLRTLLALVIATSIPVADLAGQGAGTEDGASATEGALFLLLPVGAQAVGLGRTMTAVASGESAFWNPAGLAELDRHEIVVHHGEHVAGTATSGSLVLTRGGRGALAMSYELFDVGTQDRTDGDQNVVGSISIRNHQAIVSAAAVVGSRLRAGVSLKQVRFDVTCRGECPEGQVRGSSYAVDLGLQSRPFTSLPLRFGLMAAHLGPDFQVENAEQADPLPSRIRAAAALEVFGRMIDEERIAVELLVEVEDRLRALGDPALLIGAEVSAGSEDRVTLRGGYSFGAPVQLEGAAIGFGLSYDRFELGIARPLSRRGIVGQQEPVHLSLGIRF